MQLSLFQEFSLGKELLKHLFAPNGSLGGTYPPANIMIPDGVLSQKHFPRGLVLKQGTRQW